MASTTTLRSWSAFTGKALATVAVAATALVMLVGTASAHTPEVKAGCKDGKTTLKVELTNYNSHQANTIKVSDGDKVVAEVEFGTGYKKSWEVAGDVDHKFVVVVKAWDDPDGKRGFSFSKTLTVKACVISSEPSKPTKPTNPTTTTTTPAVAAAPAPVKPASANSPALAETGASIAIPLAIGALLLLGGGVMVFIVRRHGKA